MSSAQKGNNNGSSGSSGSDGSSSKSDAMSASSMDKQKVDQQTPTQPMAVIQSSAITSSHQPMSQEPDYQQIPQQIYVGGSHDSEQQQRQLALDQLVNAQKRISQQMVEQQEQVVPADLVLAEGQEQQIYQLNPQQQHLYQVQEQNQLQNQLSQHYNVGTLISHFNDIRQQHADNEHFSKAFQQQQNINLIRMRAQNVIVENLTVKHQSEEIQVNDYNTQEFQDFTLRWDQKMADLRLQITTKINEMQQIHYMQIDQLIQHLQSTLPQTIKPSSETLNMRKIMNTLNKQKK